MTGALPDSWLASAIRAAALFGTFACAYGRPTCTAVCSSEVACRVALTARRARGGVT